MKEYKLHTFLSQGMHCVSVIDRDSGEILATYAGLNVRQLLRDLDRYIRDNGSLKNYAF